MNISVRITEAQRKRLEETARRLRIPVEELAAAAVRDLLAQPEPDFEAVASRVLEKNRELYDRLS